jgi:hypothetical protein
LPDRLEPSLPPQQETQQRPASARSKKEKLTLLVNHEEEVLDEPN